MAKPILASNRLFGELLDAEFEMPLWADAHSEHASSSSSSQTNMDSLIALALCVSILLSLSVCLSFFLFLSLFLSLSICLSISFSSRSLSAYPLTLFFHSSTSALSSFRRVLRVWARPSSVGVAWARRWDTAQQCHAVWSATAAITCNNNCLPLYAVMEPRLSRNYWREPDFSKKIKLNSAN